MDWNGLAERYGDRIFLVARSIVRDDSLAHDVAQDALLKIGRALDGRAPAQDCEAWALRVAGNAARDALRKKTRRHEVPIESDIADEARPDQEAVRDESVEKVAAAIEALPAGPRDVLLLKFREGLSGPEIAAALGVSLEAAWQKLSRAMRLLKSRLSEEP